MATSFPAPQFPCSSARPGVCLRCAPADTRRPCATRPRRAPRAANSQSCRRASAPRTPTQRSCRSSARSSTASSASGASSKMRWAGCPASACAHSRLRFGGRDCRGGRAEAACASGHARRGGQLRSLRGPPCLSGRWQRCRRSSRRRPRRAPRPRRRRTSCRRHAGAGRREGAGG